MPYDHTKVVELRKLKKGTEFLDITNQRYRKSDNYKGELDAKAVWCVRLCDGKLDIFCANALVYPEDFQPRNPVKHWGK